jgi:hypothetical protein
LDTAAVALTVRTAVREQLAVRRLTLIEAVSRRVDEIVG